MWPPNYELPIDDDLNNVYEVGVAVSDGAHSATMAVTVTVNNVNDNVPRITSSTSLQVPENTTAVQTVTASDADGDTPMFSLSAGADKGRFVIDADTGDLSFLTAEDRESPMDADANNVYEVYVTASDGALVEHRLLTVRVTDVNDNDPVIAGATTLNLPENTTFVQIVTATDADEDLPLTFSIQPGADADDFTIGTGNGVLAFAVPPSYESPSDGNGDNVYNVTVRVSDGSHWDELAVAVTIEDVNEAPRYQGPVPIPVGEGLTAVEGWSFVDDDGDTILYSITGGSDADAFIIDGATGALAFATAPDYEAPTDADEDGIWDIQISAHDGTQAGSENLSIQVIDHSNGIWWDRRLGSAGSEYCRGVAAAADGGYVLFANSSAGAGQDKTAKPDEQ